MRASDFQREHFINGRTFSQADFRAYIDASEQLSRTVYTRYLPFLGGGILLSVLFSQAVGGFVGNMLAVVSIFAGLIAGGICNIKASRRVTACAEKLGITRQDVSVARQHVKNGTLAWTDAPGSQGASAEYAGFCTVCGKILKTGARFCTACGTPVPTAAPVSDPAVAQADVPAWKVEGERRQKKAPERPVRAVYAAAMLVVAWVLLIAFQCAFGIGMRFLTDAPYLIVAALLGTAAYLVTKSKLPYRLFGAGTAVLTALVHTFTVAVSSDPTIYSDNPAFFTLLSLRGIRFGSVFGNGLLFAVLTVGAAFLISLLVKTGDKRKRARLCGGAAAVVFLLYSIIHSFVAIDGWDAVRVVGMILSALGDAACLYLVFLAVYALCTMPSIRVRLRGIGLVWAWIAAFGMAATLVLTVALSMNRGTSDNANTAQLIVGISGLFGYILLLSKRRVGLSFILIGCGVMLGAQAMSALTGTLYSAERYLPQLFGYLAAGLNPLFAYLAVRAGSVSAELTPLRSAPVCVKVSGFQKAAAWISVIAGGVGILFPIVTLLNGAEAYNGGMLIYMIISAVIAVPGVILLVRQHSSRGYGKGLCALGVIAFCLGMLLLLISLIGIIVNLSL